LLVIQEILRDIQNPPDPQMEKAVPALLSDYQNDKELTAFTALDSDEFNEPRRGLASEPVSYFKR